MRHIKLCVKQHRQDDAYVFQVPEDAVLLRLEANLLLHLNVLVLSFLNTKKAVPSLDV